MRQFRLLSTSCLLILMSLFSPDLIGISGVNINCSRSLADTDLFFYGIFIRKMMVRSSSLALLVVNLAFLLTWMVVGCYYCGWAVDWYWKADWSRVVGWVVRYTVDGHLVDVWGNVWKQLVDVWRRIVHGSLNIVPREATDRPLVDVWRHVWEYWFGVSRAIVVWWYESL